MPPQPYPRPAAGLARLLVGLLFAIGLTVALAESVSVGDLRLDYGGAWQRANAEEEAQAESVILRRAEASGLLTVTIPKHQSRLRVPEARFYQQLETVWRAGAGEALRLDWLQAGGRRWRVARRPSVEDHDRAVFHLVSVAEGLAHHLVVSVPATLDDLPPAVVALLAGAPAATEAASVIPAVDARPLNQDPAPTLPAWRLEHTLHVLPDAATFDVLMRQERERLRPEGGITGMGIAARAHGFTAFLSGFVQTPNRRALRRDFDYAWEIAWEAPAAKVPSGSTLMLRPSRLPAGLGLRVSLRRYCGSDAELKQVVQRLQQSVDGEAAKSRRGCAAPTVGRTLAEIVGPEAESRLVAFPVETTPASAPQLLVLSVQPFRSDEASGAALLGAAAVHYLYRLAAPGW